MTAPNTLTEPDDLRIEKRIEKALTLREGGASYARIAEELSKDGTGSCSITTAHGYVMRGLDLLHDRIAESAERIRALENRRLDRMMLRLEARQDNNSPAVTLALLRIMERRAKLNNLDLDKDEPQLPGSGLSATAESRDTLRGKLTAIRSRTDALGVTTTEALQIETSMPLPALGDAVAELAKENGHVNGNGTNGDHA